MSAEIYLEFFFSFVYRKRLLEVFPRFRNRGVYFEIGITLDNNKCNIYVYVHLRSPNEIN